VKTGGVSMVKLKDAHKVLGLKEGASENEIEKRYTILFKKYKSSPVFEYEYSIDDVTRAYNLLMGYEHETSEEDIYIKPNPIFKLLRVDDKKARNFLHYHKSHIIIGIIALVVLVSSVRSCVMRPPVDLNLAFIGRFFYNDTEEFQNNIKEEIQEIRGMSVDAAIIYGGMDGEQEYAMQMKLMVLLAAGDVDVYLLDMENYKRFAKQGAFKPLDEIARELGVNIQQDSELIQSIIIDEETGEKDDEHLYGIDVSESKLFEESEITGDEYIAAIGIRAKNINYAVELLDVLLKR
jgi:hypothetical protein